MAGLEREQRCRMQGQLARLQNALDASRRDGERREAALKQAVATRSRAEVDLAEAREQLRNGDERCTVLRQQLAKACSSLEAAGLPLPAKAPVDTRASLVRRLLHSCLAPLPHQSVCSSVILGLAR